MLRKWSWIVSAAVVLGSMGRADAQNGAEQAVSAQEDAPRAFQVDSEELLPEPATSIRKRTTGVLKISVNDHPAHTIRLDLDQSLAGRGEHRLVIEDVTANVKVEYAFNPETSVSTIRFQDGVVRVTHGSRDTYSLEGRDYPNAEAAGAGLADERRLKSLPPELIGGIVRAMDIAYSARTLTGATKPTRLLEAWQAAASRR